MLLLLPTATILFLGSVVVVAAAAVAVGSIFLLVLLFFFFTFFMTIKPVFIVVEMVELGLTTDVFVTAVVDVCVGVAGHALVLKLDTAS